MRVFLTSLPFHAIDYIVLALLFYGLIGGLIRGLAGEVARAIVFLALLATLYHVHPQATRFLEETTHLAPEDAPWVAFAALMVAAIGVYAVSRALAKRFFKRALGGLNQRFGGAVAGLLRGAVLAALLLLAAGLAPIESLQRAVVEDSWFGQRAHTVLPDAYQRIADRYALPPYPAPPAPDTAEPGAPAHDRPEF